ncbi:RluA family pseudouridine synthase [Thalassotalea sp. HSM 43]|uniref:RluA family pseudouridine synthase n=1 Tax=Thalassotalea sp. HSM 43 TaxID=2552945 RepID=UPI0010815B52|nr:RluA family pseudouridine synthase [Thalassotalea sp. HSM 43]QBY05826.1 RluA family pseudouridine synthase [Thalassotalea sp. HSM 43]
MPQQPNCFHAFQQDVSAIKLPARFTFPFYYQPHPLAEIAAEQLQQTLLTNNNWQHNFGLNADDDPDSAVGKMFGILVVQDQQGQLGYLSAFSGKVADTNALPGFVPPVFDMLSKDSFFKDDLAIITKVSNEYKQALQQPLYSQLQRQVSEQNQAFDKALAQFKGDASERKAQRKQQRAQAKQTLSEQDYLAFEQQLSQASVIDKLKLRDLKVLWQQRIQATQQSLDSVEAEIQSLAKTRRKLSNRLQKRLFSQYRFLNNLGERKDLNDIFAETPFKVPPAGAGECAAPKLLQYAFEQALAPICMAEFWWGRSPKSEIRRHKHYYPSCYSKCQPILGHMLEGLALDENPLLINPGKDKHLAIVYEDNDMVVVNKPSGLLSVPGKNIDDSVYSRIKRQYPQATGPLIVHRLDMSTSGLMVLALTSRANKALQRQFVERSVNKNYIAEVTGIVEADEGEITLPLTLDIDDRPRQKVCFDTGKPAHTIYKVMQRTATTTRLSMYPKTGRTHQLRVHCAHPQGLNMAIVGDEHYGTKADRLRLHAEYLQIKHPITQKVLSFKVAAEF